VSECWRNFSEEEEEAAERKKKGTLTVSFSAAAVYIDTETKIRSTTFPVGLLLELLSTVFFFQFWARLLTKIKSFFFL
jgi:hypothetical protein